MLKLWGASLILLAAPAAFGQSEAAPAFDVASVKPGSFQGGGEEGAMQQKLHTSPGSVDIRNFTLRNCVQWAYDVKDFQVTGPDWTGTERFDVMAKTAGPASDAQLRLMLRTLLADRFKLAFHRETKELPIYALIIGKNGPKLTPSQGPGDADFKPGKTGKLTITLTHTSMAKFAELISNPLQRPVVDMTGLEGGFDFTVDVSRYFNADAEKREGSDATPRLNPPNSVTDALTMALQEQLGLKLEARKSPIDMIVIDHAEKAPTGN